MAGTPTKMQGFTKYVNENFVFMRHFILIFVHRLFVSCLSRRSVMGGGYIFLIAFKQTQSCFKHFLRWSLVGGPSAPARWTDYLKNCWTWISKGPSVFLNDTRSHHTLEYVYHILCTYYVWKNIFGLMICNNMFRLITSDTKRRSTALQIYRSAKLLNW